MKRLVLVVAFISATSMSAVADDRSDVQAVIGSQLDAFRRNDGAAAYGFAAPNIQRLFPSPDIFMQMVEAGYGPVFRSQNATFGALRPEGSGLRQEVYLSDSSGGSWIATYTLERQLDGTLKITSCQIRTGRDLGA